MATESASVPDESAKVVIYLRPTGGVVGLKKDRFRLSGNAKFARVINYLRGQIGEDTLFVYVNSAFSPNPDELISDLYNNFGINGQLVVNYANCMAWG